MQSFREPKTNFIVCETLMKKDNNCRLLEELYGLLNKFQEMGFALIMYLAHLHLSFWAMKESDKWTQETELWMEAKTARELKSLFKVLDWETNLNTLSLWNCIFVVVVY